MPCFHQATVFQPTCQYYCQWQYDAIKIFHKIVHTVKPHILYHLVLFVNKCCHSMEEAIHSDKKDTLFYFLFSFVSEMKAQARATEIKQQCRRKSPDLLTPSRVPSPLGCCSLSLLCFCYPPDLLVLTWQTACFWQDLTPFLYPHTLLPPGNDKMSRKAWLLETSAFDIPQDEEKPLSSKVTA